MLVCPNLISDTPHSLARKSRALTAKGRVSDRDTDCWKTAKLAYLSPASGAEAATTTASSNHRRRTSRGGSNTHKVHLSTNLNAQAPAAAVESEIGLPAASTRHTAAQRTLGLRASASPMRQHSLQLGPTSFHEDDERDQHMSLDRSPSPRREDGWSSPGLSVPYDEANGGRLRGVLPSVSSGMNGRHDVTWASAKQRSAKVSGYPSYHSTNQGFFGGFKRRLSMSLPYAYGGQGGRFADKEKLGRGRLPAQKMQWKDLPGEMVGLLLSRRRKWYGTAILVLTLVLLFFKNTLVHQYRKTSWLGGGSKFVIILGANQGGGVMEWKGAREWAIERDSVKNKKRYAEKWGYNLHIVDMSTKKRYAHEWRESWEKVDMIGNAMKKYPDAEWFWWLDLNTFIMEPSYSLQSHIFDNLGDNTYRDINKYNPLKIKHPPNGTSDNPNAPQFVNYLDAESLSPVGDGKPESINLIVPQDCGGFNLGSFFVKRSDWTDRILDIWWDPVFYEQRHMEWEHKEQDALEYIYTNQPWIRPHVAFVPQRKVNSFPNGACGDDRGLPVGGCKSLKVGDDMKECGIQGIHYQQDDRDFLVNMAGCEWGRDCWGEMYNFRQLSNRLNRNPWEKFKDLISETWNDRKKKDKAKENQGGMGKHHEEKHEAEKKQ